MSAAILPSFTYTLKKSDCGGRWRGRTIRIFKRTARPYWYCAPGHGGKQHRTLLKTEARETAIVMAIEVCDRVWSGVARPEAAAPKPKPVATIGQILAVYRQKGPLRQKGRRTVQDNENSLRMVVREGLGQPTLAASAVDAARCDVFTATLARRFEESRLARLNVKSTNYREARQSTLVSVNAYLRAARSILQPDFRPWYVEDAGLMLADWEGFMSYEPEKPRKEAKLKPARELVVATFEAAAALREADPQAYYAWLLGVYSLRRSEIQRCARDWLRQEVLEDDVDFLATGQLCWVIRTDRGKSDRERVIPVPDSIAEEILAWWEKDCAFRAEHDRRFLIPAGRCLRTGTGVNDWRYVGAGEGSELRAHGVIIRINEWMRGLGWTTRKTLHEMRALFLRKARAQFGARDEEALKATAQLAGHQCERTTEQHYTGAASLKGKIVEFPLLQAGPRLAGNV